MRLVVNASILLAVGYLVMGCNSKEKEEKKVTVRGKVTLDAKPLAEGKIFFGIPGKAPQEIEIKNGQYEGQAFPGDNRVEIGAYRPGKPPEGMPDVPAGVENYLPEKYHSSSILKADVKADGSNEFDFKVTSK